MIRIGQIGNQEVNSIQQIEMTIKIKILTQKKRMRKTKTSLNRWYIGNLKRIGRRLPEAEPKLNSKRMSDKTTEAKMP